MCHIKSSLHSSVHVKLIALRLMNSSISARSGGSQLCQPALYTPASQPGCQSLLSTEVASAVRTQEASFDTSHLWSDVRCLPTTLSVIQTAV